MSMTGGQHFTKTTPIGCILGFFWLIMAALAGICFRISYKAYHLDPPKKDIGSTFLRYGIILSVILLLMLIPIVKKCLTSGKTGYRNGRGFSS